LVERGIIAMGINRRGLVRFTAAGTIGIGSGLGPLAWAYRQKAKSGSGKPEAHPRRGVNLCGAEFGTGRDFCNENPGRLGREYTYNSERSVAYFAEHGISLIRLPFRWERIQPRLGMPLDPAELERLKLFLHWARRHGATVILDPHNYGRYRIRRNGRVVDAVIDQEIGGSAPVTRRHFADLWNRLSAAFGDDPAVEAYGLMNEPHDMGRSDWKAISQAAVDAIRRRGDRKLILVPGDRYSNSEQFAKINGRTAWINDPAGRVAYEAHCYFDSDFSGSYRMSYDAELARDQDLEHRGSRRIRPFIDWCSANRVQGFVGEFGLPGSDPHWLTVLADFLRAIDQAGMEGCWWAAGEWWPPNYPLLLQPRDQFRRPAPQLETLLRRG
jgi:endoglucanase